MTLKPGGHWRLRQMSTDNGTYRKSTTWALWAISTWRTARPRARRLKLIADRFQTNGFYRFYPPEEVGRVYSQLRIVFNTSLAGDVNMRVFEGAACGALVLTDSVANGLGDLFAIGREIVTYANDADLLDKIAYYLAHEDERMQIARAGYQRTQAQHTYAHRVQTILDTIGASSFERLAPMRRAGRDDHKIHPATSAACFGTAFPALAPRRLT